MREGVARMGCGSLEIILPSTFLPSWSSPFYDRQGCPEGGKKEGKVHDANRNKPTRGPSVLQGQDMGKTQNHRNSVEQ